MLGDALLRRRFVWFGHVERRDKEGFGWSRLLVVDRQADRRKHGRKIWRS